MGKQFLRLWHRAAANRRSYLVAACVLVASIFLWASIAEVWDRQKGQEQSPSTGDRLNPPLRLILDPSFLPPKAWIDAETSLRRGNSQPLISLLQTRLKLLRSQLPYYRDKQCSATTIFPLERQLSFPS
jgi:hypothetical protein